jgi:thioredoxin 1
MAVAGAVLFCAAGLNAANPAGNKPRKTGAVKATFVELGSVNCVPCKAMQPVMQAIEREYGDQVNVVFYDVWTNEGKPYGKKYKVQAIPTQVFLDKNGKEYFRHIGYFPKEEVIKVLEKQGVQTPETEEKAARQRKDDENGGQ